MYIEFYHLEEKPFNLTPSSRFLYLSENHKEALALLSYGIMERKGFILLTGEVGTGKTTLCRAYLENLDENTHAAYIFNPRIDSIQLLKVINDEFGISSDADNTKDLIDAFNSFLIEKNNAYHTGLGSFLFGIDFKITINPKKQQKNWKGLKAWPFYYEKTGS